MVTHMAGMAAKRVPPAAAAAMLHYCTSLGVLPPTPASALFSYVHKCAPVLLLHHNQGSEGTPAGAMAVPQCACWRLRRPCILLLRLLPMSQPRASA
jgi:hypothetical protein